MLIGCGGAIVPCGGSSELLVRPHFRPDTSNLGAGQDFSPQSPWILATVGNNQGIVFFGFSLFHIIFFMYLSNETLPWIYDF